MSESIHIWVHSDLQLHLPELAEETLGRAVDDLLDLRLPLDEVWCLGDALCDHKPGELEKIARINQHHLARLQAPVCYVMGNHEMDLKRIHDLDGYPLHEVARRDAMWHVADLESPFLVRRCGEYLVVLMGDHAAHDGRWWTTHGVLHGEVDRYPHLPETYQRLRRRMERYDGSVILASHYAFPGGQRPSPLLSHLLPLPANVCLHLHGHAHIGDLVHNKERPWQRKNPIEGTTTCHQYNISALETLRTPGSHSALLSFGPGRPMTLRIRCHLAREWVEEFEVEIRNAGSLAPVA